MAWLSETIEAKRQELIKKSKYRFLRSAASVYVAIDALKKQLRDIHKDYIYDADARTLLSKISAQFTYLRREIGNMSVIPNFFSSVKMLKFWRARLKKIHDSLEKLYVAWTERRVRLEANLDKGAVKYYEEVGRLVKQCTGVLRDFDNAVEKFIERANTEKPRQIEKGFNALRKETGALMDIITGGVSA